MPLRSVSLDDKYTAETGTVFLTGTQALVRLPLVQRRRDLAAGLNTGGFISGYRGSPVGAVDRELWRMEALLEEHHVHFRPGVNEDLAATSLWGSQQINIHEGGKYDGVFGIWYGKGPGIDRSGDAMRHANLAGTARHGGVLAVVGDDHALKSTDTPAHGEPIFMHLMMPVLYPADITDMLEFGLKGWAMSRYTGSWIGFKVLADLMDSSGTVDLAVEQSQIVLPEPALNPEDVEICWPAPWLQSEERQNDLKLPGAIAFARANAINRVAIAAPKPRLGIIAAGKSYLDVRRALRDLGIDDAMAAEAGVSVLKIGMPWPLDLDLVRDFADGLEEVLVVEEKRRLMEVQVRDALYELPDARRPRVTGRRDSDGNMLMSPNSEVSTDRVAEVVAGRLKPFLDCESMQQRLEFLTEKARPLNTPPTGIKRTAFFCSGCPHASSTKIPEGSRAMAGVGCHYMTVMRDDCTSLPTHMGGEGAPWIGQAPFSDVPHIFANVGEGTYYHSASLAIRACIAAEVNITFKILFNDATAMTGGQPIDGPISVPMITNQMRAEGVERIFVVAEDPSRYGSNAGFASGTQVRHRDELDEVQRELRQVPGVSVLVYDQVCAAEKRRRRKRGTYPDPAKRIFINPDVCDGCGDCHTLSNCLSVVPVDTPLGRRRVIDQSGCNKDYTCAKGGCPSFVVVKGGGLRKRLPRVADIPAELPAPELPALDGGRPWGMFITGVGGTGVVTIGALMGMAAHLEGKAASIVDSLGMSQKGGAVVSHVQFAARREDIVATRLNAGGADVLLGCDLLVAAEPASLAPLDPKRSRALVNSRRTITGAFTVNPDLDFPTEISKQAIREAVGAERSEFLDATGIAEALVGNAIAGNIFMLGYAWQQGLVPLGEEALLKAIEINGVSVAENQLTFRLGRWAAVDRETVERLAGPEATGEYTTEAEGEEQAPETLEQTMARLSRHLTAYQDADYAARHANLVARTQATESSKAKGRSGLAEAVARGYFKLLAIKDEYEVARLYSDPAFRERIAATFEGVERLEVLLAPPLISRPDPKTGKLRKRAYGPWVFGLFRLLASLKGLRGGPWDIFGRSAERRAERALIGDYEETVSALLEKLDQDNHALAVEIAALPDQIRGYGPIKERNRVQTLAQRDILLERFKSDQLGASAAE
jgi:indolepyruvate ferredoxin oxidoreductase